jgi:uncharacterized repeat protein (TIGR01451 family)
MKKNRSRSLIIGFCFAILLALGIGLGAIAHPGQATPSPAAVAQRSPQAAPVELELSAEKRQVIKDDAGQEKIVWQALKEAATVVPSDTLRYSLVAKNNSQQAMRNLVIPQPIAKGMVYVIGSATVPQNAGANVTFSIDNGKTFVAKPMVTVKRPDGKVETIPAPAETYTHIRWHFGETLPPQSTLQASYQVRVK